LISVILSPRKIKLKITKKIGLKFLKGETIDISSFYTPHRLKSMQALLEVTL